MTSRTGKPSSPVRRVLIAVHYFPPHVGGIEQVALMESRAMGERAIDVSVLTSSRTRGEDVVEPAPGVTVRRVRSRNPLERFGVPFPLFAPIALLRAARAAVRTSDAVHIHDVLYMSSWITALWCRIQGTPYVVTQHVAVVAHPSRIVNAVQHLVYGTIGRAIWGGAQAVFYLNARVRDSLIEWGVADDSLRPLANGVNLRIFRPAHSSDERACIRAAHHLPADTPLVLFVGRLVPKKGFQRVVAAAGRQDDWHAVIVGAGPSDPSARNVHWLGALDQDQLSALYRACDLFVLPSVSEGFPLTLQEAMASGLPVITTDDPGYSMYGLDRNNIHLLGDGEDLAATIASCLSDGARRESMGAYSREFAQAQFSWDEHVTALLLAMEPAA